MHWRFWQWSQWSMLISRYDRYTHLLWEKTASNTAPGMIGKRDKQLHITGSSHLYWYAQTNQVTPISDISIPVPNRVKYQWSLLWKSFLLGSVSNIGYISYKLKITFTTPPNLLMIDALRKTQYTLQKVSWPEWGHVQERSILTICPAGIIQLCTIPIAKAQPILTCTPGGTPTSEPFGAFHTGSARGSAQKFLSRAWAELDLSL